MMSDRFVDVTRFIAFQFVRHDRKTRRINQQVAEFSRSQYSHNVLVMVIFHSAFLMRAVMESYIKVKLRLT